jgi:SHS2 domain-containing protein
VRLALPQPFEDLDHTADVGVRVAGATAEETFGRLALAMGALLAGGGAVERERADRLAVTSEGGGRAGAAIALLRELLFRFATERRVPAAIEVLRRDADGAEVVVESGRWDPERHAEGLDLKAVTWHAARLEPSGSGWIGQVVFDI